MPCLCKERALGLKPSADTFEGAKGSGATQRRAFLRLSRSDYDLASLGHGPWHGRLPRGLGSSDCKLSSNSPEISCAQISVNSPKAVSTLSFCRLLVGTAFLDSVLQRHFECWTSSGCLV